MRRVLKNRFQLSAQSSILTGATENEGVAPNAAHAAEIASSASWTVAHRVPAYGAHSGAPGSWGM